MSSLETHLEKYLMFRNDAEIQAVSAPLRIEAYFYAAFHLIEAAAATQAVHINKHQKTRKILEENPAVFSGETETVWRAFQEIENQIRPGQVYGGAVNGGKLVKAQELFGRIETAGLRITSKYDSR